MMRLFPANLAPILVILMLLAGCSGPAEQSTAPDAPTAAVPAVKEFPWLRMSQPDGWRAAGPGAWDSPHGSARAEVRERSGAEMRALCMAEANHGAYGPLPEIREQQTGDLPGCLILPAGGGEALYLLRLPDAVQPDGMLALVAPAEQIEALVAGLSVDAPAAPAGGCDFSLAGSPAQVNELGDFRVDEFPLAGGASCSPLTDAAAFYQHSQAGPLAERVLWLQDRLYRTDRLKRVNEKLAPFGYEVRTTEQKFRLMRRGEEVRGNLSWLGQVTTRADGQDLIFPVLDGYNAASFVARADGLYPAEGTDLLVFDLVFPVYAGDDEIRAVYDYTRYERPVGNPAVVRILRNDEEIAAYSVSGATPAGGPVRGLWAWEGRWVLDLGGLVVDYGQILNDRLGASEVFGWRILRDRPFYFYRQDGQVRASYDGQPVPGVYDEVIYGPQWSERMLVQMKVYEAGMVFFARRGDTWYAVVYEVE